MRIVPEDLGRNDQSTFAHLFVIGLGMIGVVASVALNSLLVMGATIMTAMAWVARFVVISRERKGQ